VIRGNSSLASVRLCVLNGFRARSIQDFGARYIPNLCLAPQVGAARLIGCLGRLARRNVQKWIENFSQGPPTAQNARLHGAHRNFKHLRDLFV